MTKRITSIMLAMALVLTSFASVPAKAAEGDTHHINFYAKYDGGSAVAIDGLSQTFIETSGDASTTPISPAVPVKVGYTSEGWYSNEGCTVGIDAVLNTTSTDVNVYAKYTSRTIELTYKGVYDGELNSTDLQASTNYLYGTGKSSLGAVPDKTHYTNDGKWYKDAECTVELSSIPAGDGVEEPITTVYAKYTNKTHNITYKSVRSRNGSKESATALTVENPTTSFGEGKNPTLPSIPSMTGFTATGWFTDEDCTVEATPELIAAKTTDVTLYALYTANKIPVTYVLNDDNSDFKATNNEANPASMEASMTLNLKAPTRNYYTFDGWYDNPECTGTAITAVQNYVEPHTYYAKWTPVEYTLTYNTNGGSEIASRTFTVEDSEITLSTNTTKSGYEFHRWLYQSNTITAFNPAEIHSNITVYADWATNTYTITYELNGGYNSNYNPTTYTVEDNIQLNDAEKGGYTFKGWYEGDNKITNITPGTTGNKTLTASFEPTVYNIIYEVGDGTLPASAEAHYTYGTGLSSLPVPTPNDSGKEFEGWYLGNEKFTSISSEEMGNITLTAHYSNKRYTITYASADGVDNYNNTSYEYGTGYTFSNISKPGYTFLGWYDENDYQILEIGTSEIGDKIVKAKWELNTYTITYLEKNNVSTPATYTFEESVTLTNDEKVGYTFLGWYNGDNEKVTSIPIHSTGNITLTAKWEANVYHITYRNVPEGVTNSNPTTYTYGRTTAIAPLTRTGYAFQGWYDTNGNKVDTITATTKDDITLEPRFIENGYKITYTGTEGANNTNPTAYKYGTETVLKDITKPGYTFLGWYDGSNNKVTTISKTTTGDITLKAQFRINTYTITYNDVPSGIANPNPTTYTYGTAVTLSDISRSGYNFLGWYDAKGNKITSIPNTSAENVVITAKWDVIIPQTTTFTITYMNATGTVNTNPTTYTTGTAVTLTSVSKKGYTFKGWYDSNKQIVTTIPATSVGNLTLTAYFTANKYTISYKNTGGVNNPNPTTYTYGTTVTLKNLTKDGYVFAGWFLPSGKQITKIAAGSTGNATLTAKWSQITVGAVKGIKVSKKSSYKLVKYNKLTNVTGYQIQYTLSGKTYTKKINATSYKLKKKAKNIRIRAYKKVNGKFYYGSWSKKYN